MKTRKQAGLIIKYNILPEAENYNNYYNDNIYMEANSMIIFYNIEVLNQKLLQDVFMGKITINKAHELKLSMTKKKNKNLTVLLICAAVFALSIYFGLSYETYQFADSVMFLFFGGMFISSITAIFRINGLAIALRYLSALRRCHPGSVTTTSINKLLKLNRIDKKLLEQIESYKFTDAEARGLRNIAEDTRALNIKFTIFALFMGALMSVLFIPPREFWSFGPQDLWDTLYESSMSFLPKLLTAVLGVSIIIRLVFVGINIKYIKVIKKHYH